MRRCGRRNLPSRVGFALCAGAAVTILTAWALAVWGTVGALHGQAARPPVPPGGTAPPWGAGAPEHLDWPIPAPPEWPRPRQILEAEGFGVRWAAGTVEFPANAGASVALGVRTGWPLPALMWTKTAAVDTWWNAGGPARSGWQTGLRLPKGRRFSSWGWMAFDPHERRLPLAPVWPGFAINAAVYAGAIGAAWWLAAASRRALRRRRGACRSCGYAVGAASICPECGSPR